MAVKFFGQYLVDCEHISSEQLADALGEHDDRHFLELATAKALLSESQAIELAERRKKRKGPTAADEAVRRGWLTEAQCRYLEFLGKCDAAHVCETLMAKGYIDDSLVTYALEEFNRDQASYSLRAQHLPEGYAGRSDIIALVSMTENIFKKHEVAPFRLSEATLFAGGRLCDLTAIVHLDASRAYVLSLEHSLAVVIAGQLFGVDDLHVEEVRRDAVCELANIIVGSAAAALAGIGYALGFAPPQPVPRGQPLDFARGAARWYAETPWGRGAVLIQ